MIEYHITTIQAQCTLILTFSVAVTSDLQIGVSLELWLALFIDYYYVIVKSVISIGIITKFAWQYHVSLSDGEAVNYIPVIVEVIVCIGNTDCSAVI